MRGQLLQDPRLVIVAGDSHRWAPFGELLARMAGKRLASERRKLILQVGDFGYWPNDAEGRRFLKVLSGWLDVHDAELWFIDGNHEDHGTLAALKAMYQDLGGELPARIAIPGHPRISWMTRGHRWSWHGRTWLAVGGAVSVDKAGPWCRKCSGGGCRACSGSGRVPRRDGVDWFPGEEITIAEAEAAIAAGPADVLMSHDCPARIVHSFAERPDWFAPADVARAEAHAELLQCVVNGTRPAHIMHGHLHMGYQRYWESPWGTVDVTGLDRNKYPDDLDLRPRYNWGVLDVEKMTWDITPSTGL